MTILGGGGWDGAVRPLSAGTGAKVVRRGGCMPHAFCTNQWEGLHGAEIHQSEVQAKRICSLDDAKADAFEEENPPVAASATDNASATRSHCMHE